METETITPEILHLRFTSGYSVVIVIGNFQYPVTNVTRTGQGGYAITVRTGEGNNPSDRFTDYVTADQCVRVTA